MKTAKELRDEADLLMTEHQMSFVIGPRTCLCGSSWPCPEWDRAEELLKEANGLPVVSPKRERG